MSVAKRVGQPSRLDLHLSDIGRICISSLIAPRWLLPFNLLTSAFTLTCPRRSKENIGFPAFSLNTCSLDCDRKYNWIYTSSRRFRLMKVIIAHFQEMESYYPNFSSSSSHPEPPSSPGARSISSVMSHVSLPRPLPIRYMDPDANIDPLTGERKVYRRPPSTGRGRAPPSSRSVLLGLGFTPAPSAAPTPAQSPPSPVSSAPNARPTQTQSPPSDFELMELDDNNNKEKIRCTEALIQCLEEIEKQVQEVKICKARLLELFSDNQQEKK